MKPAPATITTAQLRILQSANERPRGNICPTVGIHAAAQTTLINALDRKGLIEWHGGIPHISDAGRAAVPA